MEISAALSYYKQREIQEALVRNAKNKEVVGSYDGKGYAKRPDVLQYPNDVLELVKKGITSFHASEELWENPLNITLNMKKDEVEKLRLGWDLVLDIDCKELSYSAIAGYLLIEALKYHGVKSITVKFSGNHGFHIAVPFEAFTEKVNNQLTKDLFPEAPRKIASYLQSFIEQHLKKMLLEKDNLLTIAEKIEKEPSEILKNNQLDPFLVLDIDTILISPRHLYRMPYSFNEKSGLVSVPINPNQILDFDKKTAEWQNIKVNSFRFLDRTNVEEGEANNLIVQAFDKIAEEEKYIEKKESYGTDKNKEFEVPAEAIPETYFPPCIKKILEGLEDGRKRAVFILMNFFRSVGWSYEQIEERLKVWNKANKEPLREVIMLGQVRYHKQHKKSVLPPNCDNKTYYIDFHVCQPDNFCRFVKNPSNYSIKKSKSVKRAQQQVKDRPKLTEEQKEMRRKHREKLKQQNKETIN